MLAVMTTITATAATTERTIITSASARNYLLITTAIAI